MRKRALRIMLLTALATLGLLGPLGATPALAQEPLSVDVSVQAATVDPRTGDVTISATVTCSDWSYVSIGSELRQDLGRLQTIRGSYYWSVWCAGPEGTQFTLTPRAYEGRFGAGNARLLLWASAYQCDEGGCEYANDTTDLFLHLRPA